MAWLCGTYVFKVLETALQLSTWLYRFASHHVAQGLNSFLVDAHFLILQ